MGPPELEERRRPLLAAPLGHRKRPTRFNGRAPERFLLMLMSGTAGLEGVETPAAPAGHWSSPKTVAADIKSTARCSRGF